MNKENKNYQNPDDIPLEELPLTERIIRNYGIPDGHNRTDLRSKPWHQATPQNDCPKTITSANIASYLHQINDAKTNQSQIEQPQTEIIDGNIITERYHTKHVKPPRNTRHGKDKNGRRKS